MNNGSLYIVSTPIGNLGDISQRALETLAAVDLIAAEDTRHTGKLLKHFQLSKPLISYHDHNELSRSKQLVTMLQGGTSIALVSDAGTPGISDPGYRVVKLAAEQGLEVVPIPGPSAFLAALAISGLPTDRFLFEGFLPRRKGRTGRLKKLSAFDGTTVLYEAPQRIGKTLTDLLSHLGDRPMALCRELTKQYEEVLRGTIVEVMETIAKRKSQLRGECVLVIGKTERSGGRVSGS